MPQMVERDVRRREGSSELFGTGFRRLCDDVIDRTPFFPVQLIFHGRYLGPPRQNFDMTLLLKLQTSAISS